MSSPDSARPYPARSISYQAPSYQTHPATRPSSQARILPTAHYAGPPFCQAPFLLEPHRGRPHSARPQFGNSPALHSLGPTLLGLYPTRRFSARRFSARLFLARTLLARPLLARALLGRPHFYKPLGCQFPTLSVLQTTGYLVIVRPVPACQAPSLQAPVYQALNPVRLHLDRIPGCWVAIVPAPSRPNPCLPCLTGSSMPNPPIRPQLSTTQVMTYFASQITHLAGDNTARR